VLAAGSALRAVAGAAGLVRYIRRERIAVLHGTEKPRDAFVGVVLARLAGARSVVHMHVGYDDWLTPRVKWALGRADAIVAISRFVSESLVRAGYSADRIHTVHNSLDLSGGGYDRIGPPQDTRRELGIALDAPVICIASRLFRWKGHHDLVDAVGLLRNELPDVRLLIVGEDDPRANPGGGSYRDELAARVAELGLGANVLFTGFRTDVARLMAAADIFCQPSAEEPFGMVYLEAMAVRRPVVGYASGGAPEVVSDGETGLLVPRGDVPALSRALLRLLRDPALRRAMGEAGRRRVEEVFPPQRSAAALLDVYRAVTRG
jgi:glycosyltransferase involved in cell wall biosynthesis